VFEKLLSLLLQAKGGAVATVFVLGTTGALVTATVDNGLTTITITQPSATTTPSETTDGSTTTNTTVTETILALFNRTNGDEDPTSTATGNGCSDEAHARNLEMKRVDDHAKTTREAVKELSKDAPRTNAVRTLVDDADDAIKDIRHAAKKAIHATFDCDKDDEDEDQDEDQDEDEDEDDGFEGEAIGDFVSRLLAGIVVVDALMVASVIGWPFLIFAAMLPFTLALQQRFPST
jgi:hypothetical protein